MTAVMTLRERYEAGVTVEQLALDMETYPGKIRKLLREQGTTMRPKGSRVGVPKGNDSRQPTGQRPDPKPPRVSAAARQGKRRRGWQAMNTDVLRPRFACPGLLALPTMRAAWDEIATNPKCDAVPYRCRTCLAWHLRPAEDRQTA